MCFYNARYCCAKWEVLLILRPRENPCDITREQIFLIGCLEGHGHGPKVCGDVNVAQFRLHYKSVLNVNLVILSKLSFFFNFQERDVIKKSKLNKWDMSQIVYDTLKAVILPLKHAPILTTKIKFKLLMI